MSTPVRPRGVVEAERKRAFDAQEHIDWLGTLSAAELALLDDFNVTWVRRLALLLVAMHRSSEAVRHRMTEER